MNYSYLTEFIFLVDDCKIARLNRFNNLLGRRCTQVLNCVWWILSDLSFGFALVDIPDSA